VRKASIISLRRTGAVSGASIRRFSQTSCFFNARTASSRVLALTCGSSMTCTNGFSVSAVSLGESSAYNCSSILAESVFQKTNGRFVIHDRGAAIVNGRLMKRLTWQSQFWCPGAVEQENLLGGPERPFLSTPERSNLSVDPLRHVSPN